MEKFTLGKRIMTKREMKQLKLKGLWLFVLKIQELKTWKN